MSGGSRGLMLLALVTASLLGLPLSPVHAQIERNQTIEEALEYLASQGVELVYSSDLIRPWMRVRETPDPGPPQAQLRQILRPYGLTVQAGSYQALMVVRATLAQQSASGSVTGRLRFAQNGLPVRHTGIVVGGRPATTDANGEFHISSLPPGRYVVSLEAATLSFDEPPVAVVTGAATTRLDLTVSSAENSLEEVVVSASQYRLLRSASSSFRMLDSAELQLMPDLGDDPLRAVARLPGTSSNVFSGKINVRGGQVDETLVRFDGLRLYNPFHLKDFNSLFSSIDPGVVENINVYTGAFPVPFGDRMSGVIDINPLLIGQQPRRELSLSFFNSSLLLSGATGNDRGQWLASARVGHLDQILDVIDPKLGDPRYSDYYARGSYRLTPDLTATASFLLFRDDIRLSDGDDEEVARGEYRDRYQWLRLDYAPAAHLSGSLQLAQTDLRSERSGTADQSGISSGWLSDRRNFSISSVSTDWQWLLSERAELEVGADFRHSSGRYHYAEEVEFAVLLDAPGAWAESDRSRSLAIVPGGDQYAVYGNLRLLLGDPLTVDLGLRYDRETLSESGTHQLSPRLSALYRLSPASTLRVGWGRYFQAQSIDELQVSDGIEVFAQAQRADHWVVGYQHSLGVGTRLRVELYHKQYKGLRPRFENILNSFVLLPELKPDRVLVAPQRAEASGLEVTLGSSSAGPWHWWTSYSLSAAKDEIDGERFRRGWENRHVLRAGIQRRGEHWDFSLAGWYASGWPTTALEIDEEASVIRTGPRNGERLGARSSLDLRLARRFELAGGSTLTAFLEVNNLLDRTNPCCVEYEYEADLEDGVSELTLESESVRDLPFFPSLGLIWRF